MLFLGVRYRHSPINERPGVKVSSLFEKTGHASHILIFNPFGITPELLQVVKPARLRVEDVHDGVKIIHTDPLGMLGPFDMAGFQLDFVPEPPLNVPGNRPHLCGGVPLTDNKIIRRGIVNAAKVQQHYFLAFDICDTIDDQILEAAGSGLGLNGFFCPYQMFTFLTAAGTLGVQVD